MGTSRPNGGDEHDPIGSSAPPSQPFDAPATMLSVWRERGSPPAAELVVVRGEVDLLTAPRLAAALEAAQRSRASTVVVDVGGLAFCDIGGLRLLAHAARQLADQGRAFVLRHPSRFLRRLLDVSGLGTGIMIEDAAQQPGGAAPEADTERDAGGVAEVGVDAARPSGGESGPGRAPEVVRRDG